MKSKFILITITIALFVLSVGFIFGQPFFKAILPIESFFYTKVINNTPTLNPKEQATISQSDTLQDKFEKDLLKIKGFRDSGTFEELIAEGDKIEKQWGNVGGDYYGELSVEFLSVLSSNRYAGNNDTMEKSRELTSISLKKADTFDLSLEWKLLLFLGSFDYPIDKLNESQVQQRRERVELWLHAIRRLESEKDKNFNPDNVPSLKVMPPLSTNLPAGVSPQAIQDTKLRAEYEKAIVENNEKIKYYNKQLRIQREEKFFVEEGVKYISTAYLKSPGNLKELEKLLKDYNISENVRKKVLKLSKKNQE